STPVLAVAAEPPPMAAVQVVGVDQRLGAHQVVEHLARTGCRGVVPSAGPSDWFDAVARRRGFEAALEELGLDGTVVGPGDWTPRAGYELCQRLIREGLPEAIFAANDMMAIGVIHALHEHDLRVPEDVAVVGFDNFLGSEFLIPPLTTVSQPFAELGRAALQPTRAHPLSRPGPLTPPSHDAHVNVDISQPGLIGWTHVTRSRESWPLRTVLRRRPGCPRGSDRLGRRARRPRTGVHPHQGRPDR